MTKGANHSSLQMKMQFLTYLHKLRYNVNFWQCLHMSAMQMLVAETPILGEQMSIGNRRWYDWK